MKLTEKRRQEQKSIMEKRRAEVVACAMLCFCKNGIETTALSDIAGFAQVGEATLYRYFSTKENLVLECGIYFWKLSVKYYEELAAGEAYRQKTGAEQIADLLAVSERIFAEHRNKFKFLHDLDVFLTTHKIDGEKLEEYAGLVDRPKPYLCHAIEKGKADGTVVCKADTEELYYTLTHAVLSLMQKLAGMGQLLPGDNVIAEERRIRLLMELLLAGLKKEA